MKLQLRITLLFALSLSFSYGILAQEVSGGFKTGLNFSRFESDIAQDAMGNDLESYDFATGFHVGAIVNVKFTDYFGLRGELLYSQKGTDYNFNGPSYFRLYNEDGSDNVTANGNRSTTVNITNSYIDIPIMAYIRFGRIELAGGVSAGLLLRSTASGEIVMSDLTTTLGRPLEDLIISVDANYFQDEYQITDLVDPTFITIFNSNFLAPSTIGGYYDANDTSDNLFRRIDLGLNAQVGFYLNQGLFLSVRMNYGLSDLTIQNQDIDYSALDGNNVILRDDNDRNLSIQTSIGFSF